MRAAFAKGAEPLVIEARQVGERVVWGGVPDHLDAQHARLSAQHRGAAKYEKRDVQNSDAFPPLPVLRERVGVRVLYRSCAPANRRRALTLPSPGVPGEGIQIATLHVASRSNSCRLCSTYSIILFGESDRHCR